MLLKISQLLLVCHLSLSNSFHITSHTQNKQSFVPGHTLSLTCKSNSAWEFCLWKHTNSDYKEVVVRDCLMEWKRAKGGVAVQKCHEELTDRISISGDYDNQECGLTITGLEVEDGGSWECEMEEYKFGDWFSGNKHSHSFDVNVKLGTTTTSTTTATTTFTTTTFAQTTITTSASTTATTKTITTEVVTEEEPTVLPTTLNYPENISHHEEDLDSGEVMETDYEYEESIDNYGYPEEQVSQETMDSNKTSARSDITIYNEDVEALAIEDEASAWGSVGLIVGIVVLVLGLAAGTAVGGIFWNRKRKSIDVISLHKIKDNSGASKSFLEDSEYHVSIGGEPEE